MDAAARPAAEGQGAVRARADKTFIAGLRSHGLTAPWVIDRPMNRRLFEAYVETQLAPTLSNGDIVNLLYLGLIIVCLPYSRQGRTILDKDHRRPA